MRTMLTTIDNPYNPFTQFDEWRVFDESSGYHSLSMLARIVKTSDELSDTDYDAAIEDGIDQICEQNVIGVWRKISEDEGFVPLNTLV